VSEQTAKLWAKNNGNITYFETSAKDSTNINSAFERAAKEAACFGSPNDRYFLK
jgi:hypothetical protein